MKRLFVLHSCNLNYGACISLKHLIRGLNEKVDLMVPKGRDGISETSTTELRRYFGKNIRKIYVEYIPFISCYHGKVDRTLAMYMNNLKYYFYKNRIHKIIQKNKYDMIHLNSLVLFPMLQRKYNAFLHVREWLDINPFIYPYFLSKFKSAKGVIYIENSTYNSVNIKHHNSIILSNPINQAEVLKVDQNRIRNKYKLQESDIVFMIAGVFLPWKGVQFVVEAFHGIENQEIKLLVVGGAEKKDYEQVKELNDNRIILTGEINKMEEVYAIADYIIRGEKQFGVGRTVYEGAFSGCGIILPGEQNELNAEKTLHPFQDNIFLYTPRNRKEFIIAIEESIEHGKKKLFGLSNIVDYVDTFNKFVRRSIDIEF